MRSSQHWSEWVRDCESRAEPYVIITMLANRGSTPRDAGTKMVVTIEDAHGTIGGGQLEFTAQLLARDFLKRAVSIQHVENYPLGEKLGQCCGGSTTLLYECFIPEKIPVYLFGAGHVGRALAPLLALLPAQLHWVDAREAEFPAQLPGGVKQISPEQPVDVVHNAPPAAYYLIMTHRHPLDFDLMEAALRRADAAYIGVIGSQSKARRFQLRLQQRGYEAAAIDSVHCPIGLAAVPGKHPAEIAVAVAAELIAHYHAPRGAQTDRPRLAWKELSAQLEASGGVTQPDMTDET